MHLILIKLLTLFLLISACKKETIDPCISDPVKCPPPDLCAETDNCDDGILNDFLRTWKPIGGEFEGQSILGCIGGSCPDIRFTFFKDSTYLIEAVKVYPDSTGTQLVVV